MSDELTLEKLRISERLEEHTKTLTGLAIDVAKIMAYMELNKFHCTKSMQEFTDAIAKHEEIIHGNKEGLVVSVDRLVTRSKRQEAHNAALYLQAVAAVLAGVYFWIKEVTTHIIEK
jgi:hypothetical protein